MLNLSLQSQRRHRLRFGLEPLEPRLLLSATLLDQFAGISQFDGRPPDPTAASADLDEVAFDTEIHRRNGQAHRAAAYRDLLDPVDGLLAVIAPIQQLTPPRLLLLG